MKISMKAALFSACFYPGAGQFILKNYIRAVSIAAVCTVATITLLKIAFDRALEIAHSIPPEQLLSNFPATYAKISAAAKSPGSPVFDIALYVLIVCWLVGIVDAYLSGRKRERNTPIGNTATEFKTDQNKAD